MTYERQSLHFVDKESPPRVDPISLVTKARRVRQRPFLLTRFLSRIMNLFVSLDDGIRHT